ncbi:MAG: nucleotide pyrophosphohydrolase [Pseudomonadota bacterium]
MDIEKLQTKIREFVKERDWEKYHDPKNLVMALSGEVGELVEIFQWLTSEESQQVMKNSKTAIQVRHEIADVCVYLLRLCDKLQIPLEEAILEKLVLNEKKYPPHLSKGTATKYTEFKTE